MRQTIAAMSLMALAAAQAGTGSSPVPQSIDPAGTYTVTTMTDQGSPFEGTLTIRAGSVAVRQVTTNQNHMMAILESPNGLALAWLERQPDGGFKGSWHELGAGFSVTATKRTGKEPNFLK